MIYGQTQLSGDYLMNSLELSCPDSKLSGKLPLIAPHLANNLCICITEGERGK